MSYNLSSKFSILGNIISCGRDQLRNILKARIKGIMELLVKFDTNYDLKDTI